MQYCNTVNCVLTCTSVILDQIVGKTLSPENSGLDRSLKRPTDLELDRNILAAQSFDMFAKYISLYFIYLFAFIISINTP